MQTTTTWWRQLERYMLPCIRDRSIVSFYFLSACTSLISAVLFSYSIGIYLNAYSCSLMPSTKIPRNEGPLHALDALKEHIPAKPGDRTVTGDWKSMSWDGQVRRIATIFVLRPEVSSQHDKWIKNSVITQGSYTHSEMMTNVFRLK